MLTMSIEGSNPRFQTKLHEDPAPRDETKPTGEEFAAPEGALSEVMCILVDFWIN